MADYDPPQYYADSQESLALAIATANSNKESCNICLTDSISLDTHLPPIETQISIDGQGFAIDGNGEYQVFNVVKGNVRIDNLTI